MKRLVTKHFIQIVVLNCMSKSEQIPVIIVSSLLLVYTMLVLFDLAPFITGIIFILSPFLVIWLVYSVIRYGEYKNAELQPDEEWGYADQQKIRGGSSVPGPVIEATQD
jgi:hypothetical protein